MDALNGIKIIQQNVIKYIYLNDIFHFVLRLHYIKILYLLNLLHNGLHF